MERDFREVKISIFGPPGASFWKAVIFNDVEPDGGELLKRERGGKRISFLIRKEAACEDGTVVLFREGGAAGRDKGVRIESMPKSGILLVVSYPGLNNGSITSLSESCVILTVGCREK